jgi:FkbH-like protein
MNFKELRKNLSKDYSKFKKIKISVLGDSATQLLVKAIKGYGYNEKINFEIYEADYRQIERQIADFNSDLYKFNPEYVIILESTEKLINDFYKLDKVNQKNYADTQIDKIENLWNRVNSKLNCKIINFNFVEINDNVFGNYGNKVETAFIYQIRKLNLNLMEAAREYKNIFINDVCTLQNINGRRNMFDPRLYISSNIVFNIDFLPLVAKNIVDIIKAASGKINKCIILDLDNTIWGGIIGDDGINNIQIGELGIGKAFSELQMWAKQLKERGIILAICSKNLENIAKEPFINHPDMILHLDDISIFVVNWENKVDNIKYIQSVLNIGFDSMVFIDDNLFERNMIRKMISEITVPELPEDPVDYVPYLRSLNLFETISYSDEDSDRNKKYQYEGKRAKFKTNFSSIDDYLKNLNMIAEVAEFDDYHTPRIAQLTQRSNQFNLRTKRYTEQDINKIRESNQYITRYFKLEDKFGEYGLIGIVILKKIDSDSVFIDTLIVSCRVLKRGTEEFIFNKIVELAESKGCNKVIGEYLPTPKNVLVKNLYKNYDFTNDGNKWVLDIETYKMKKTFIQEK